MTNQPRDRIAGRLRGGSLQPKRQYWAARGQTQGSYHTGHFHRGEPCCRCSLQETQPTCFQGCDDKIRVLKEQASSFGLRLDEVTFMGNDVTDAECLKIVGLPVCVADSHSDVTGLALYTTNLPGGRGR